MRVLVVDTAYPAFLAEHYAAHAGLEEAPYADQQAALMGRHFGTGDAYARELRALGHSAWTVVANCRPLQLAWAREHRAVRATRLRARLPTRIGIAAQDALTPAILDAQIAALDPDVVYLQDLWLLPRERLDAIRAQGRLVVGQIASEAPPGETLHGFDLVLTSFPHYVERFRAIGVDSEYLAIAFDQTLALELDLRPDRDRPHGAVFVGGVNPRVHPAGTALLERLCARVDLEVWGYGRDDLPPESPLRAHHRGDAWGLDMYRVLADSRVVVNRHIEAAEGYANNMRLFEATGSGAALVTEAAPNLGELFDPGREVVTYADEDDLVAQIQRLLADEPARLAVAAAGQERTMRDHTYANRIRRLAEILESRLP
jgi:hypothetical protein